MRSGLHNSPTYSTIEVAVQHAYGEKASVVGATIVSMTELRPLLSADMSGRELMRWYWLQRELAASARSVGVSTSGGKQELTARLAAHLDGGVQPVPVVRRRSAPPPLAEPMTAATVLPAGQRCTQQLRRYLTEVIGPSFRFDTAMRDFIATSAGQTLAAAVAHWHQTRAQPKAEIGVQFELNRFIRDWHHNHPHDSHHQALQAWNIHRALPWKRGPSRGDCDTHVVRTGRAVSRHALGGAAPSKALM